MKKIIKSSNNFGKLCILIGLLLTVPVLLLPWYPKDINYSYAFLIPSFGSIIFGIILCYSTRETTERKEFTVKDGSIIVVSIWLYGILVGALPFYLADQLTFVQSLFEAVSGWTTTGLSAMDVRIVPDIFLFYRSYMQYCGGLGFVMFMVMLIQGKQAMSLYSAEGHPDQLLPNLGKTARTIFLMYFVYLVLGTIAYVLAGMTVFDGVNHAMCALSTGGFSTEYDSIGAYKSVTIELITICLMIIGTTNFAVLLLFAKGKLKQVAKVSEMRFLFFLLIFSVPIVAASLASGLYLGMGEAFRQSLFNIVSALSTSGFSTMPYGNWPQFSIGVMIVLMIIGGGIGSTAGGMKLTRVYLMLRIVKENMRRKLSSNRVISNPYYYRAQGKTYIDKGLESDTVGFIFTYMLIFIIGSLLITVTAGCSFTEAMFDFSSSLGTVGLSIGITGPQTNDATLLIEMIGMFLGRLEIFIVFIGFHVSFKKIMRFIKKKSKKL